MESIKLHPAIDSLNLSKDIKEGIQVAYDKHKAEFEEKQKTNPDLKLNEINRISLTYSFPIDFFGINISALDEKVREPLRHKRHFLFSKNQINYKPNIADGTITVVNDESVAFPMDFLQWGDKSNNTLENRLIKGLTEHIAKNYCEIDLAKIIVKQLFPLDAFVYEYSDEIIRNNLKRFKTDNGNGYYTGYRFAENSKRIDSNHVIWYEHYLHYSYHDKYSGKAVSVDFSVLKDFYEYLIDIININCTDVFFRTFSEYNFGAWENDNGHLIVHINLDNIISETVYNYLYDTLLNNAISNVDKFFSQINGFEFKSLTNTVRVEKGTQSDLIKQLFDYVKSEEGKEMSLNVSIELYSGIWTLADKYIPIDIEFKPISRPITHNQTYNDITNVDTIDEWMSIVKSDKYKETLRNETLKNIMVKQLEIFEHISDSYRPGYPVDEAFRNIRKDISELRETMSDFIACLKK